MQAIVNDAPVAYHVHGHGQDLAFVHAFPLNRQMWHPQVESLSGDYRTLTFDLPGFGQSMPARGEPTMASYAETLAAVLDAATVTAPAVLVGLSMGGYVLFEFFRRFPERVRALVLADTRAQPDTDEGRQDRLRTAGRALREGAQVVAETMLPRLLSPRAPEELRSQVREMMLASSPEGIAGALRALAGRPDSRPTLATINVPVLIVVGDQDTLTPLADAQAMAEGIAGSDVEVIEGAGHLSNLERPQAFNAALRRFLDELEVDAVNAPNQPV